MKTPTEKTSKTKLTTVSKNLDKHQSNGKSVFAFVDNRPEVVAQRKTKEAVIKSPQVKRLEAYQVLREKSVIQRYPVVNDIKSDEAIADEMDSGKILPYRAKLRDEVSRNGTPQQLVMLEYREYNNCQVHIHIAEATRFGHIKVRDQRHQLTPEQCEMILTYAQHILPVIDYDKRSKHSEGKGFDSGYKLTS